MRKYVGVVLLLTLVVIGFAAMRRAAGPVTARPGEPGRAEYQRIVSMAPSTTEVLFALGLGDRVVGVTRYCDYPAEALTKTQVGGFLDPNYEAVVALKPDLVVLLTAHGDIENHIRDLGIATIVVDHRTIEGILESIRVLGEACAVLEQSDSMLAKIDERVETVRAKTAGLPRPRVLISAGRDLGSSRIEEVYIAGTGQWYDEIIRLAGGENAFTQQGVMFPTVTAEGLLRLDPDVIIEMAQDFDNNRITEESILEAWKNLRELRAVKENRVYVLSGSHVTIPGPRFVQVLEEVARLLHPEADWDAP